jgi:DNA processing protein
MTLEHDIALHCLNTFAGFGPKRLGLLTNYFSTPADALRAPLEQLVAAGVGEDAAEKFIAYRSAIDPEREVQILAQAGISLVSRKHPSYPRLLGEIPVPPALLYVRGTLPASDALMIAVVGTRKITTYGRSVVPELVSPLVANGAVIVSGLAFGVDALAHEQATNRNKPTVAVLGSGIDDKSIYPKNHQLLSQDIIHAGGCILSEYCPGVPALKQHFVARNRIIAGLSVGTLVVECSTKSGSLITASHALEQNRRVYAVPGPIYARESEGPNNLLKMGAQAVTCASDILSDLNIAPQTTAAEAKLESTPTEAILLKLLSTAPLSSDVLIRQSLLDASQVITALTFLEMKGRVRNVGGGQYVKVR